MFFFIPSKYSKFEFTTLHNKIQFFFMLQNRKVYFLNYKKLETYERIKYRHPRFEMHFYALKTDFMNYFNEFPTHFYRRYFIEDTNTYGGQ